MRSDITIIIVAGPKDEPYIRANLECIARRNDNVLPKVIIVDNGAKITGEPGITAPMHATLVEGVAQDTRYPERYRASYQHGAALNHVLASHVITTRYLLILDPDFYVVALGWIDAVTAHMQKEGLAFFGAPWHPRWYNKYRYFPCPHFLCVDTQAAPPATLNFTPHLRENVLLAEARAAKQQMKTSWRLAYELLRCAAMLTINRFSIGQACDTGYLLERRYAKSALHKAGLLQPVFSPAHAEPACVRTARFRALERCLPDAISYIPKRQHYYSETGFSAYGLTDVQALGWEEFLWRGRPFGFHLRRLSRVARDNEADLRMLAETLACLSA